VPQGGAEGMLVTQGGEAGGYGLYLVHGKPVFTYNLLALEGFRWEAPAALTPGKHTRWSSTLLTTAPGLRRVARSY
jgi:hypothetical protein